MVSLFHDVSISKIFYNFCYCSFKFYLNTHPTGVRFIFRLYFDGKSVEFCVINCFGHPFIFRDLNYDVSNFYGSFDLRTYDPSNPVDNKYFRSDKYGYEYECIGIVEDDFFRKVTDSDYYFRNSSFRGKNGWVIEDYFDLIKKELIPNLDFEKIFREQTFKVDFSSINVDYFDFVSEEQFYKDYLEFEQKIRELYHLFFFYFTHLNMVGAGLSYLGEERQDEEAIFLYNCHNIEVFYDKFKDKQTFLSKALVKNGETDIFYDKFKDKKVINYANI